MTYNDIDEKLSRILKNYQENFSEKVYVDDSQATDILMEAFGITQELKSENKQFWGKTTWNVLATSGGGTL